MNLLYYLLEANAYLLILFAGYRIILSKLSFHQLSRKYLLSGTVISFILPFFDLLPKQHTSIAVANPVTVGGAAGGFSFTSLIIPIYLTGIVIMFFLFIQKLFLIRKLAREGKREKYQGANLVFLEEDIQPFSFFRLIFLPENIYYEKDEIVIEHEIIHSREKHSLDIIVLEVIKIISWCIPVAYLVQRQLKQVHEYIVDASMTRHHAGLDEYVKHILQYSRSGSYQALGSGINYKALLKNRIVMMYARPHKPVKKLMYLLPLLLLAPAVYGSSLVFTKGYSFLVFKKRAKRDIHYYPIIVDTTRADTFIDRDGKITIMQPLITDTLHEIFHPEEND
jgi:hypothetical protein